MLQSAPKGYIQLEITICALWYTRAISPTPEQAAWPPRSEGTRDGRVGWQKPFESSVRIMLGTEMGMGETRNARPYYVFGELYSL